MSLSRVIIRGIPAFAERPLACKPYCAATIAGGFQVPSPAGRAMFDHADALR